MTKRTHLHGVPRNQSAADVTTQTETSTPFTRATVRPLMKTLPLATALMLAFALVAAACGGSDESDTPNNSATSSSSANDDPDETSTTDAGADPFVAPDEITDRTADKLGVSKDSIELSNPRALGDSGCFLQTAYSVESTAFGLQYAVLNDGMVLANGDNDAVATVLNTCSMSDASSEISADDWAALIVQLDKTPTLIQVMTADDSFYVEDLGLTYSAPEVQGVGDDRTLRFFAVGVDFDDVFDVTATRSADGTFTSTYDQIAFG